MSTATFTSINAQVNEAAALGLDVENQAKHAADWARAVSMHLAYAQGGKTDSYSLLQMSAARDAAEHLRRYLQDALAALSDLDAVLAGR